MPCLISSGPRTTQLGADHDPGAPPGDASGDDGADVELLADLAWGDLPALVGERAAPRDDAQVGKARQAVDQALAEPVADEVHLRLAGLVVERQDGQRSDGIR